MAFGIAASFKNHVAGGTAVSSNLLDGLFSGAGSFDKQTPERRDQAGAFPQYGQSSVERTSAHCLPEIRGAESGALRGWL